MRRLAHAAGVVEALLLMVGLFFLDPSEMLVLPMLGATAAVGWLIASRVPGNPLGWLLLVAAGCFLLGGPAIALGEALVDARPDVAAWLLWFGAGDYAWFWLPSLGLLFTQVLLRFPDGRPPSRRWETFSWATVAVLLLCTIYLATITYDVAPGVPNPAGVAWVGENRELLLSVVILPLLASFLGSAASLVWRYRRADDTTRAQILWVAWAGGLVVGMYVAAFVVPYERAFESVLLSVTLIPTAIGVAVLRYRLYEIDRVVSRTVAYAVVTVALLATYALVVTSLSRLLPDSSGFAVAAATLAAAAASRPLLSRVQTRVDRRFDRARYDAQQTVRDFGTRLRDEVDPEVATAELLTAVHRTLAPSVVAVWTVTEAGHRL